MIMDGLESMSAMSFAEAHSHFQHLLNFDAFKAELPAGIQLQPHNPQSDIIMEESLNTPISSFMDLPVFFSGPTSTPVLPATPTTTNNNNNTTTTTTTTTSNNNGKQQHRDYRSKSNNINNNVRVFVVGQVLQQQQQQFQN